MHLDNTRPIPAPHAVELEVREQLVEEDVCLIGVHGEVDLASAPKLKLGLAALISEPSRRNIVLELSDLTYLDSTGLAVLIGLRRRLRPDQRLVIASASDEVMRLLTLTGLSSTFDTFPTAQDALHYLKETDPSGPELPLSPDAALILGLASTALPFADSYTAEAQCWQRILLPHGGSPLAEDAGAPGSCEPVANPTTEPESGRSGHQERLDRVLAHAARIARERGADAIRTGDVLRGVISTYGCAFENFAQTSPAS